MWWEIAHQLQGRGWHLSVFPGDLAKEAVGHSHGVGSFWKTSRSSDPFLRLVQRWGQHFAFQKGSGVSKDTSTSWGWAVS